MNFLVCVFLCFFLCAVDGRAPKLSMCYLSLTVLNLSTKSDGTLQISTLLTRDKITVSGLSSGGYFAVQFHVAFSSTIKGAGIIAGGK